jgi:hypothetical protein
MDFMNDDGQVSGLDFEGIPDFIREYVNNYAKPMTVQMPELSEAFQLFQVVDDLEGVLDGGLDAKLALPLLFVLWTNLITRMARIETIVSAQENFDSLVQEEREEEDFDQKEEGEEEDSE